MRIFLDTNNSLVDNGNAQISENTEKLRQKYSVLDYVSFKVTVGTTSKEPLENE